MCLAVPGKILSVKGSKAKVDFNGIQKNVYLGAIKPKIGDYILVGAGIAIQKISMKEARNILEEWKKLK